MQNHFSSIFRRFKSSSTIIEIARGESSHAATEALAAVKWLGTNMYIARYAAFLCIIHMQNT